MISVIPCGTLSLFNDNNYNPFLSHEKLKKRKQEKKSSTVKFETVKKRKLFHTQKQNIKKRKNAETNLLSSDFKENKRCKFYHDQKEHELLHSYNDTSITTITTDSIITSIKLEDLFKQLHIERISRGHHSKCQKYKTKEGNWTAKGGLSLK